MTSVADDPLARLLPVGNQGGFLYKGSPKQGTVRLAVLWTTAAEPDWPDLLDPQTGEPPRFRTPDPIRSGPERRMINARTAQKVHA